MDGAAVNRRADNSNSKLQKNCSMLRFACKSSQLCQRLHGGEVEGVEEVPEYNSCEAGFTYRLFFYGSGDLAICNSMKVTNGDTITSQCV